MLDPPRLLKNKADPSALALQFGLARPLVPPASAPTPTAAGSSACAAVANAADAAVANAADAAFALDMNLIEPLDLEVMDEVMDEDAADDDDAEPLQPAPLPTATSGEEAEPPAEEPLPHEMTSEEQAYETALAHGVRLFSLYMGAGGALCLRHMVWRKLMPALHPDRGGHTRVFQVLNELKQRVDSGEEAPLPRVRTVPPARGRAAEMEAGSDAEMLYAKIRAELEATAERAGELAISRLREALQLAM